jgi:hypothetical protein
LSELPLLALLAQMGVVGGVSVESASACPTGAEVEARLRALLPPLAEGAHAKRATLSADDGALRVHLSADDGTPLGDRTVTVEASCADRANVVAVVIAAWEMQQRTESMQAPALSRAPTSPPPGAAPTVVAAPPPPPPSPPARARLEVAAGPALAWLDGAPSAAGRLAATLWGRRFGVRVELFGLWPRTDVLAEGRARWTRVGATGELGLRGSGRAGRVDVHAGAVVGALFAGGQGFELDQTASGLAPGVVGGLDWSYVFGGALGHTFVGAGANVTGWMAQRLVSSAATPATRALPRVQPSVDLHAGVVF